MWLHTYRTLTECDVTATHIMAVKKTGKVIATVELEQTVGVVMPSAVLEGDLDSEPECMASFFIPHLH